MGGGGKLHAISIPDFGYGSYQVNVIIYGFALSCNLSGNIGGSCLLSLRGNGRP